MPRKQALPRDLYSAAPGRKHREARAVLAQ